MEINDKKVRRVKRIISFLISVVLAVFLALLCNTIIRDLDNAIEYPSYNNFIDKKSQSLLSKKENNINHQIEIHQESQRNIRKMIDVAEERKVDEQESFDNWIKTRSTLGRPSQDVEVLTRLARLEKSQQVIQEWNQQSDSVGKLIDELYSKRADITTEINKYETEASQHYSEAVNKSDLKVFLIRLLFVAPILILGIYFFIRLRNHRFSPLFMGFSLFSLYAFFVGLVPYLPSYGGYIRYTVGVLLTVGLGYYAIKKLVNYSERKKKELTSSSEERAHRLESETAEKAFNNHVCPSCGKDFLLKNWEGLSNADIRSAKPLASHYCRYCGMQLMKDCPSCGQLNYAHLPHCINCGENLKRP